MSALLNVVMTIWATILTKKLISFLYVCHDVIKEFGALECTGQHYSARQKVMQNTIMNYFIFILSFLPIHCSIPINACLP